MPHSHIHHKCREIMADLGKEGNFIFWDEFHFPKPFKLDKCLADVLEDVVDEKYYLSDKAISNFCESLPDRLNKDYKSQANTIHSTEKEAPTLCVGTHGYAQGYIKELNQVGNIDTKGHNSLWGRVYDTDGIAPTQNAKGGGMGAKTGLFKIKSATKDGYETAHQGDSINLTFPNSKTRRGRVGKSVPQTLDTACCQGVVEPYIVASRGRNPSNSSDRTVGSPTEQRLEPKFDGTTNALTTVQKDNLLVIPRVCELRTDEGIREFKDGVCGSIRTKQSGGDKIVITDRIRRLLPRECARVQGDFDDMFKQGEASDTKLYEFIGNAMDISTTRNLLKAMFAHKVEFSEPLEPSFKIREVVKDTLF